MYQINTPPHNNYRTPSFHDIQNKPVPISYNKLGYGTQRMVGLDILRYLLAFLIFLFHSKIHMKYDYGFLNPFIGMGAIAMTGFFMLSGYSLYITYWIKDLSNLQEIKIFYIKRFIGVFPIYYITALVYVILFGKESIIENVLLAPISFLGLQSIYSGTFSISHFGGTWFISCITVCYLIYPYLQILVGQMGFKAKILVGCICAFVILWSPLFQHGFHLATIYDNPLIRLLEFMIGVIIANLNQKSDCKFVKIFQSRISLILGSLILFFLVNLALFFHIGLGNYMLYNWIVLPTFVMIIMPLGKLPFTKISNNKTIRYLSAISYDFFLAQFFLWPICRVIFQYTGIEENLIKIVLSLVLCFIIAVVMHEFIEKPIGRYLKLKLLKMS